MTRIKSGFWRPIDRRSFIGGSDARIIMGSDEAAVVRLWREERGGAEPEDLSGNLIVDLGAGAEPRRHREGHESRIRSQIHAALVILRRAAAEKYMAQVQHNMWVTHL